MFHLKMMHLHRSVFFFNCEIGPLNREDYAMFQGLLRLRVVPNTSFFAVMSKSFNGSHFRFFCPELSHTGFKNKNGGIVAGDLILHFCDYANNFEMCIIKTASPPPSWDVFLPRASCPQESLIPASSAFQSSKSAPMNVLPPCLASSLFSKSSRMQEVFPLSSHGLKPHIFVGFASLFTR